MLELVADAADLIDEQEWGPALELLQRAQKFGPDAQVSHGLQLQSLSITPTAAVSQHGFGRAVGRD